MVENTEKNAKKFNIPVLKDFDSLLHCNICKDILNVPVLTPCNHTYCSRCIRDYLRNCNEKNCPLCLNDLNESSLRSELLLNEICRCYKNEISTIFTSLTKKDLNGDITRTENKNIEIVKPSKPFGMFKPTSQKTSLPSTKKAKNNTNSIIDMFSKKKKQKIGTDDKQNKSKCPICNNEFPLKFLQEEHIDNCLTTSKPGKTEYIDLLDEQSNNIEAKSDNVVDEEVYIGDDSSASINEIKENDYMKSYLQSVLKSSNTGNIYTPLPKLQLHDISTSTLKQNLSRYQLNTQGQKYNLIQRWKQWDVLYTSNFVDNPNPKDIKDLQRELNQWDMLNNKPIIVNSNNSGHNGNESHKVVDVSEMFDNKKINIKDDKFSRHQWEVKNKREYKKLIIVAKRNLLKEKNDNNISVK
ncbi:hypothetical protein FOG48_03080 [Hanseniaspora uvarum]|nr:hypothetical protein FOG48_03080 [Hanseniaspora uvarum]